MQVHDARADQLRGSALADRNCYVSSQFTKFTTGSFLHVSYGVKPNFVRPTAFERTCLDIHWSNRRKLGLEDPGVRWEPARLVERMHCGRLSVFDPLPRRTPCRTRAPRSVSAPTQTQGRP